MQLTGNFNNSNELCQKSLRKFGLKKPKITWVT